ncbi:hypothetical protein F2Q70_00040668 [Brassica cretica]|uniref:Uncharacterized protein n=1 Tax=Brassica cretica TaxID=69181 RepID=A0A8S9K6S7_BRACR|nr:hypothetical protein F2Q70_00040668 [Brassica cretica]
MGRVDYLAMKTDVDKVALVNSDVEELKIAAKKLLTDVSKLGGLAFGVSFVKWIASFSAIYLLILDRTNWRTKMLTSLLIPYIFLTLPGVIFNFLSGDVGKWIAFVAVVLRLFFPKHFPGHDHLLSFSCLYCCFNQFGVSPFMSTALNLET